MENTLLGYRVELSAFYWEIHGPKAGVFLCEDFPHLVQSIAMLKSKREQIDYLVVPELFYKAALISYPLEHTVC